MNNFGYFRLISWWNEGLLQTHFILDKAMRRQRQLRPFMMDFIQSFAPHLNADLVNQALDRNNQRERNLLFADIELPKY